MAETDETKLLTSILEELQRVRRGLDGLPAQLARLATNDGLRESTQAVRTFNTETNVRFAELLKKLGG